MLTVLAVMGPIAAATLAPVLGAKAARRLILWWLVPGSLGLAVAIAASLLRGGAPLVVHLGGIAPPLGIALRADGLSACFLLTSAAVMGATFLFLDPPEEDRRGRALWSLLPALWGGVNLAFVAQDLFSIFIALELLTFAAIPLVALDGSRATLEAALRYLLFALLGSVLVLLATALLYGSSGALDLALLRPTVPAAALLTIGLMAKAALVPLHAWLPPAHAGAPAAVSAVLSALVVKAGFFLLLRLWFGPLAPLLAPALAALLALLGAAAILTGGVMALRQARLKMLVAYSTVAQLGYLMLVFPLALAAGQGAWLGGVLQAASHAVAKAAMFMAAGSIAAALGHDRIAALAGAPRLALLAFALAGLSLMGIPPSGGFTAKWLLLGAAIDTGQWWWALAVVGGGVLTGGYLYRVLAAALRGPGAVAIPGPGAAAIPGPGAAAPPTPGAAAPPIPGAAAPLIPGAIAPLIPGAVAPLIPGAVAIPIPGAVAPRRPQAVALGLALLSVLLGLLPLYAFGLVEVGR